MQRIRRGYTPVIATLTFLIVAAIGAWFVAQLIAWSTLGAGLERTLQVPVDSLTRVEAAVATGVGAEVVTVTLGRGIWTGELDINTEDYDGVKLESTSREGNHSRMWWNGSRDVIIVGDRGGQIYPGDVSVSTNAVPGYKWTVTFTRHDVR